MTSKSSECQIGDQYINIAGEYNERDAKLWFMVRTMK
jgi:hypothetical protein